MPTGTLTTSPAGYPPFSPAPIRRTELRWTSDASGAVDQASPAIDGAITRVEFVPSASAAPTNGHALTLSSLGGIDVLGGAGASLSGTVPSTTVPTVGATGLPFTVAEPLRLVGSGCGASKAGTLVLYYRP